MAAGFNRAVIAGTIAALARVGDRFMWDLEVPAMAEPVRCMATVSDLVDVGAGDDVLVTGSYRSSSQMLVAINVTVLSKADEVEQQVSTVVGEEHARRDVREHEVAKHQRRLRSGRVIEVRGHKRGGRPRSGAA